MFDVISIGAATVDILVMSHAFSNNGPLLSLNRSSKNEISDSLICSGGGATNSSVSFSRLGLKTACVSQIGTDLLSSYVKKDLDDNRVNTFFSTTPTTDFSVILIASDGSRSILTNRGSTRLEESNISWKSLSKTKWFYVTSLEGNLDLLEKIIGFALENHIKVSLNPGLRELKQLKKLKPLLKFVDFFLLNRIEAQIFTGIKKPSSLIWKRLTTTGARQIAVTNGRRGAHLLANGKNLYSPIINTHPADETGAGDSFGSAFVAALCYGLSSSEALFWGIKNSASVVSTIGAKPGLLTYDQITK